MTEAMPFLQKYDITFLRPPTICGGIFIILAKLRPYNIGKINIRIYQNSGNIIKIGIANNK